jgi:hypothetical protein
VNKKKTIPLAQHVFSAKTKKENCLENNNNHDNIILNESRDTLHNNNVTTKIKFPSKKKKKTATKFSISMWNWLIQ